MNDEHENLPGGEEDVYVAEPNEDFYEDEFLEDMPGWPKPVGILSIVFGGIAVTCTGLGIASMFIMPSMMSGALGDDPVPPSMQPTAMQIVATALGGVANILLIVAGISCLARNISTRYMHLVYSVLMVVLAAWGMLIQFQLLGAMDQYVADYPDNAVSQGYSRTTQLISAAVMTALSLAWPAFCLIWFGVVKKTENDLTGGVMEAAA